MLNIHWPSVRPGGEYIKVLGERSRRAAANEILALILSARLFYLGIQLAKRPALSGPKTYSNTLPVGLQVSKQLLCEVCPQRMVVCYSLTARILLSLIHI